ncbi:MAG: MFS transporter, partial [Chloroflexota bacterium]|nr:MFS transporter [Chloroflexota bacterium]
MSDASRARIAYVTLFTAVGAWAPYLPVYYRSLGVPLSAVGGLAALAAATGMLAAPAWGTIADRFAGSRWVLPAAAFAGAGGATLLALAETPAQLVIAIVMTWLAMAGVAPVLDARAVRIAGADRNRYAGFRVWGSASFVVSAFLVGVVIDRTVTRDLFAVYVPALVATAIVAATLRPAASVAAPKLSRLGAVLRHAVLMRFLLAILVAWSANAAVSAFLS